MKAIYSNLAYDCVTGYGDVNASLSADGSLSFYVKPLIDIDRLFVALRVDICADGSDDFNIDFMNKTVNVCKFFQNRRYEPLLQLTYKIISAKIILPKRCPIKKVLQTANIQIFSLTKFLIFQNDLFHANNFIFETDQFPPILLATKISIYVKVSTLKKNVLRKICDGSVVGEVTYLN